VSIEQQLQTGEATGEPRTGIPGGEVQYLEAEVLPSRRPAQEVALGQLFEQVEALQAARTWAETLCAPDNMLCPQAYRGKVGSGIAAILYGAELGLNPTQSLQQVFVVNGAPAIYARTAVALCKRAGILIETVESNDERVTVKATDPRTGQIEQSTWDTARSQKAGYHSNKKYGTDPQAMHYAKAAMEVCRKIAPDVLLGIPLSREELELEQQPVKVKSERNKGTEGLKAMIGAPNPSLPQGQEYAETEPTPEQPEVKMATPQQLRRLSILRKQEGFNDDEEGRAGWFDWIQSAIQVEVSSNKELTETQAGEVISIIESAEKQQAENK